MDPLKQQLIRDICHITFFAVLFLIFFTMVTLASTMGDERESIWRAQNS